MKKYSLCAGAIALLSLMAVGSTPAASGRDHVVVVGSSTVYPFATTVAERFGRATGGRTPTIESTGSGGGLKLFCAGDSLETPDVANASRRIKPSEYERCREHGVASITEVKIGYDGIVLANSRKAPRLALTKKDIFLALAREVPDPDRPGRLIANPFTSWHQVNPDLPDMAIEVLGPPPTSGTRDAFVELAMEGGCQQTPWIKALKQSDTARYKSICHTLREDGAYIEAGENDNLLVRKLEGNPGAVGIFGFSFLDQNSDRIQGALINGSEPTFEQIATGRYPISRPLFIYIKNSHVGVVPGLIGFLEEFTSERAWGEEGYLADKGLISMSRAERERYAAAARQGTPLQVKPAGR